MLNEKLDDLKKLIPDFEEIDLIKNEILNKKDLENHDRKNNIKLKKISIIFAVFLFIVISGTSSILIYNYSINKSVESSKEQIKKELNLAVENIDESTVIQSNKDYINNIINENVNSIDKSTTKNETEIIYSNTLDSVLNAIITEDASIALLDQVFTSGKLYYDQFIGNSGPIIDKLPDYTVLVEFREKFRFYGSYNDASVLFVLGDAMAAMTLKILEYEFYYPTFFDMFVTKDKVTYKLNDESDLKYVIENEILTESDIKKIYQIHTTWVDK